MPKDMGGVMKEYKGGKLHSGSKKGPVVKSKKQAIAIGLSEQRAQKKGTGDPAEHHDGAGKPMSAAKHKKMYSFPTADEE